MTSFRSESINKSFIGLTIKESTCLNNSDVTPGIRNAPTLMKSKDLRKIYLSQVRKTKLKKQYPSNRVTTAKYSWWLFFPFTLLFQFKRYANIYFLISTIIQCIPILSPLNPFTAVIPFIIVLGVSILREGLEECKRHKEDRKENMLQYLRYNIINRQYEDVNSEHLEVGDVVYLKNNSIIPADCLLLFCANTSKMAYVMTSNLDGEKNLKPRFCHPVLYRLFNQGNVYITMRGKLIYNKPDPDLTKFNGRMHLGLNNVVKLDARHVIYKGTKLENTKFAIALVLYTGNQTKIVMNSQKCPPKQSHLERTVNFLIVIIFGFQVSFCIILSGLNSGWFGNNEAKHKYLELTNDYMNNRHLSGFLTFWSYLLLLNTMIPISLVVTIEIAKYSQAFFMDWDVEMYSKVKERFSMCNTCSLNEELGQIKYIFSDKTGTLTANKLEFTSCVIGNCLFGMTNDELKNKDGKTLVKRKERIAMNNAASPSASSSSSLQYTFPDKELKEYSIENKLGEQFDITLHSLSGESTLKLENMQKVVSMFLYCLSLNHTCFIQKTPKPGVIVKEVQFKRKSISASNPTPLGQPLQNKTESVMSLNLVDNYDKYDISYSGENPDEIILVDTARRLGYIFLGGDETLTNLRISQEDNGFKNERWSILQMMKFTSARGKMSTIVQYDSHIILLSKGSNAKILQALGNDQPFKRDIEYKSNKLSEMGLRVLWIGMKVLDENEFYDWKANYDNVPNENIKQQDILIAEIEKGMTLIGCTAVEDNLQEKVPDTIKDLQTAGINIWVLTGDNLPTARNITISCKLLPSAMELYEIYEDIPKYKEFVCKLTSQKIDVLFSSDNLLEAIKHIETFEQKFPNDYMLNIPTDDKAREALMLMIERKAILYIGMEEMVKHYRQSECDYPEKLRGILIEAAMLSIILPNSDNKTLKIYAHPLTQFFLDLTLNSQAVVCCRVSPLQKALVVRMIKDNIKGAITLAIGDGANDVSMIQEADVGVGIFGEEGTQAAMSSDYAFGDFKSLRRLILFHGRLNYLRIADMILYFFFKNFLFTLPQFFFGFYCAYSAKTLFDDWFVSLFNLIFTALPLGAKALIDQDINDDDGKFIQDHLPYTYYKGREGIVFNLRKFFIQLLQSACFALLIHYTILYIFITTIPLNNTGQVSDYWVSANSQFTAIIFFVNYRLILMTKYHTWFNWGILLITSYGIYIAFLCISSLLRFMLSYNTVYVIFSYPQFYLSIFGLMHFIFIFDWSVNFITLHFIDNPTNLLEIYRINTIIHGDKEKEEDISRRIKDFDIRMRKEFKVQRHTIDYLNKH